MLKLSQTDQKIISVFLKKDGLRSSDIFEEMTNMGEDISLVTIKRYLSKMTNRGFLTVSGTGRATSYKITVKSRIFSDVDAKQYISLDPDSRYGLHGYNFDLLKSFPSDIFTEEEMKRLEIATKEYEKRTKDLSDAIKKKELERLVIELAWKSSKIEGNTYTILDTEKLILENKEAAGHSKAEARMILNHKDAFEYIHKYSSQFKNITRKNLEELHAIIIRNLDIEREFRTKPVGVVGSIYRPLDNIHQIADAIDDLASAVIRCRDPYAKALTALLGISYIQLFEDGNKRTSRLMANALLMSHSLAPLSYRSVSEEDYRDAMLVFYELNSIVPMRNILIGQYEFATQNYAVK